MNGLPVAERTATTPLVADASLFTIGGSGVGSNVMMFNGLIEDWFNHALEIDYAHFITTRRMGVPMVNLVCDFLKPSKIGEIITHLAFYSGWPTANTAVGIARQVFADALGEYVAFGPHGQIDTVQHLVAGPSEQAPTATTHQSLHAPPPRERGDQPLQLGRDLVRNGEGFLHPALSRSRIPRTVRNRRKQTPLEDATQLAHLAGGEARRVHAAVELALTQ